MSGGEFDLRSRLHGATYTEHAHQQCSRAQCTKLASQRIEWRNPRIHTPDRKKIWLACDEHAGFLLNFLQSRSFPTRIANIHDAVNEEPIE